MNNAERNTQLIKIKAKELGFFDVGFSKAAFLETEAPRLEKWLSKIYLFGKFSPTSIVVEPRYYIGLMTLYFY